MRAKWLFLALAIAVGSGFNVQADQLGVTVPVLFQDALFAQGLGVLAKDDVSDAEVAEYAHYLLAPTLSRLEQDASHSPGDILPSRHAGSPVQIVTRPMGDSVAYFISDEAGTLRIEMSYNGTTRKMQYHEVRLTTVPGEMMGSDAPVAVYGFIDIDEVAVQPDLGFQSRFLALLYVRMKDGSCNISRVDVGDFRSTSRVHGIAYNGYTTYDGPDIGVTTELPTGLPTAADADSIKAECSAKLASDGRHAEEHNALWFQDDVFDFAGQLKGDQSFADMLAAMPWKPSLR